MNKKSIRLALLYGMSEEALVASLKTTHEELRQFAAKEEIKELDTSVITSSLIEEVMHKNYSIRKIASRYRISQPIANQIYYNGYTIPNPAPEIDLIELIAYLDQGYSVQDIAKQFETTPYYIRKTMAVNDLVPNRNKLTSSEYNNLVKDIAAGVQSHKHLAKRYNISQSMVSQIKRATTDMPPRKTHNRANKDLIRKLIKDGHTQESIALQLDISQATVSRICRSS